MKELINRRFGGKNHFVKRHFFVYMLTNTHTGEIIYIGQTSDEYNRSRAHTKTNYSLSKKMEIYIHMLKLKGESIKYTNIKEFDNIEKARSMERKLIEYYKPICNVQYVDK